MSRLEPLHRGFNWTTPSEPFLSLGSPALSLPSIPTVQQLLFWKKVRCGPIWEHHLDGFTYIQNSRDESQASSSKRTQATSLSLPQGQR